MRDDHTSKAGKPRKRDANRQQIANASLSLSTAPGAAEATTAQAAEHTLFKSALNASSHGILIMDASGSSVFFNKKFRELCNIPDLMRQNTSAEELIEHIAAQMQGSKEDIEKFRELPASTEDFMETLLLKNNRMIHCQCSTLKNGDTVLGRLANFRDISKQIKLELALRESEEMYRSFVSDFKGIAYKADLESWTPLFFHGAVDVITGYPASEFIKGSPRWDQLIHPDDLSGKIEESVRKLREEPNYSTEREYRIIRKDGQIKWVQELTQNICDETGKPVYCQGVIYDITDRRKLEQELIRSSKLESVGTLAGGIAHDFNNLLTAIIGNLSLAKDKIRSNDEALDNVNRARKACSYAKDLTQQLLTFSKGGAPVKRTIGIAQLIRDSAVLAVRGSSIRCKFGISSDLWPVKADGGQIKQVINNLVLNARQSMWGGGTVEVTAQNVSLKDDSNRPIPHDKCIKISVADQGVGIHAKHLNKIFDPYYTTRPNGTGLGLATAHSIVQQHGGHIAVESELGFGATFHIFLPASDEIPPDAAAKKKPADKLKKVLVMDDEELVRQVIGEMLAIAGYEAEFAGDGDKAIELFNRALRSEHPFDAVILDLTVPGGIGGLEVVKALREIDPEVKAIVSSGYSDDPVLADHTKHGFAGCVAKPYEFEELHKALEDLNKG